MLKNSKVEEVLHLSYINIDKYLLNVIKNNLGLNITLLDYRIEESIRNYWRNINPLVQELHLNTVSRFETTAFDEPGLKLLTLADPIELVKKLLILTSFREPIQHKELFVDYLTQKIVLHSYSNEALSLQTFLDWRTELEDMQDNEFKHKILPSMLKTVYALSCVIRYVDKSKNFDIEKILQRGDSLYLTPGVMCKDQTSIALANLFLADIFNWFNKYEPTPAPKVLTPYLIITSYTLYDQEIISGIKQNAIKKGIQLVLTN